MTKLLKPYCTKNGAWQISWTENQKQQTLYLGKSVTKTKAEQIAKLVTEIHDYQLRGETLPQRVKQKLASLPPRIVTKMDAKAVCPVPRLTVRGLCEMHRASKIGFKPKTQSHYSTVRNVLLRYFDGMMDVQKMDRGAAENFCAKIRAEYAEATFSHYVRGFRNVFSLAIERGLLAQNPFQKISCGKDFNPLRHFFVTRSVISKILEHCRNDYERLALVLGRFGGLRIPSEVKDLTFADFANDKIRIHEDTKTGARFVPLFAEIREIFERLAADHSPDERIFAPKYANGFATKFLLRAMKLANIPRWPKLWINLRSTRITELMVAGTREKTLDNIFGNSARVRSKHYEQWEMEEEYRRMLGEPEAVVRFLCKNGGSLSETENIIVR